MKHNKKPASSSRSKPGAVGGEKKVKKERWRGGGGGGGGGGGKSIARSSGGDTRSGTTKSNGGVRPGGRSGGGANRQKVVKNALRNAQLDKSQLLMWRKFGYGEQLFAQYYKKQNIMPVSELPVVESKFATPLPITFRLHATDPRALDLAARLRELAKRRPNPLVKPLPWMPEGEGWQVLPALESERSDDDVTAGSRTYVQMAAGRRQKLPEEVAELIRVGTDAGLLARQEAVSMLPVLVLAPALPLTRGSRVLDVCAAPGNKTMQLLERCAPPRTSTGTGTEDTVGDDDTADQIGGSCGLVVANDAHPGRVKTLQEAITRHCRSVREMESLVITCAMGQNIPVPTFFTTRGGDDTEDDADERRGYDAVLADVPCSGDGTLRKDHDVLRRWHPGVGNCLHATQLAVARRAAALVRPGGLLLYSTCTLNPIEDEAVVAAILTGPGGDEWEIEAGAVDRGAPGMRYRPGVSTWGVAEHVVKGEEEEEDRRRRRHRRRHHHHRAGGGDVNANSNAPPAAATYNSDTDESESEEDRDVSLRWYDTHEEAAAAGMVRAFCFFSNQREARSLHSPRSPSLTHHSFFFLNPIP